MIIKTLRNTEQKKLKEYVRLVKEAVKIASIGKDRRKLGVTK